jgi:hypothetical protein
MLTTNASRRQRSPVALSVVILCLFMLSTMLVRAQPMVPQTISYQGRVTVGGQPFNGVAYAKFAIVNVVGATTWSNDGSSVNGSEPATAVPIEVRNGVFSILLGEAAPLLTNGMAPLSRAAFPDGECTLFVWFSTDGATFSLLGPPRPIAAVPYAYVAADADMLDGYDSSSFAMAGHNHMGQTWSGSGYGLTVESTSSIGLVGATQASAGFAWGVVGRASATSGNTRGVIGQAVSPSGVGVEGNSPVKGVLGVATSDAGPTYGVHGKSSAPNGYGVYGENTSTGTTYGVYGKNVSSSGAGVMGKSDHAQGAGVRGESSGGHAIEGVSTGGVGVYGSGVLGGHAALFENATTNVATAIIRNSSGVAGAPALVVTGTTTIASTGSNRSALSVGHDGVDGRAMDASVIGEGGIAVRAFSHGTLGPTKGVYAYTPSANGQAIYAENPNGVAIQAVGDKGVAVYARSEQAVGLYAYSDHAAAIQAVGNWGTNLIEAQEVYGASTDMRFRVDRAGNVYTDGSYMTGGADMAELLPAVAGLEPGDVLAIGLDGDLVRSSAPYQTAVAGVYSTKPGIVGGAGGAEGSLAEGQAPLAILGVVPTKVSAENGAIAPGDLLTTSATHGHAMRAGSTAPMGTILGKALEPLAQGTGVIRVLVTLH